MGKYTRLLRIEILQVKELVNAELIERFYPKDLNRPNLLDLDKSLEGIFFLLTGSAYSPNINSGYGILFNGHPFVPADGVDPDAVFIEILPDKVQKLNALLVRIELSAIRNNYDPLKMMEACVYPEIWTNGNESYDYLVAHFTALREFIKKAATESQAILLLTA